MSDEPAVSKPRPKFRRYLVLSLILLPFTMLGDLALRLQNADLHARLLRFSEDLGHSVAALDPFVLAKVFYNRLSENQYSWRLLQADAPFNLSEARRRFEAQHPSCSLPWRVANPLDYFQRSKSTPPDFHLLLQDNPVSGSYSKALVEGSLTAPTPSLTEILKRQRQQDPQGDSIFRALTAPTPQLKGLAEINRLSADGRFDAAKLAAESMGLAQPQPTQPSLLATLTLATPVATPAAADPALQPLVFPTPYLSHSAGLLRTPSLSEQILLDTGLQTEDPPLAAQPPTCSAEEQARATQLGESPLAGARLIQFILGVPDAVFQMGRQAKSGLDGGLASAIIVLLLLLFTVALVWAVFETHPLMILALPLLAGIAVWVLLLPVRLVVLLFPHALSAVELFAFAASLPPVLWVIQVAFAVAQTAAVDKAMESQDKKPS